MKIRPHFHQFPEIWPVAERYAEIDHKLFCVTKGGRSFEKWRKSLPKNKNWIYEYVTQFALPKAVEEFGANLASSAGQLIAVNNQALEAFSIAYDAKLTDLLKSYNGIREDELAKKYPEVERLISLGKKKGFLTFDEINDGLPADIKSSDQIDEVMMMIGNMDIEVVDDTQSVKTQKQKSTEKDEWGYMKPIFWPHYPKYSGKLVKKEIRLFPPSSKKQREDNAIIDRDILGLLLDGAGKSDVRFYQNWEEFLKIENMPVPKASKPTTIGGVDYETDPAAVIIRFKMTSDKFKANIDMINDIKDKAKKLEGFEKLETGYQIFYPDGYIEFYRNLINADGYLEGYLKTSQEIAHSIGISFTYYFFLEYIRNAAIVAVFTETEEDCKAIEQDCLARGGESTFYQLPKKVVRMIKDEFLVKI